METRGWANIVPPAIRATATTPNLVFILYFLLPRWIAFYGPIAKLLEMLLKILDSRVFAAREVVEAHRRGGFQPIAGKGVQNPRATGHWRDAPDSTRVTLAISVETSLA
jgi:hypothetical protein